MTKRTAFAFGQRRAKFQRGLGYLLLCLLAYGVTIEAAQSHVPVSRARADLTVAGEAIAPQTADQNASHSTECTICQFQAQLSSSLIHAPSLVFTRSLQRAMIATQQDLRLAIVSIATSDRAPPRG